VEGPFHTIAKEEATGTRNEQGENAQIQSVLRLKDTLIAPGLPVAEDINQPAARITSSNVANEARDVDQAIDHRRPLVRRGLKDERVEDVDRHGQDQTDGISKERIDDTGIDKHGERSDEHLEEVRVVRQARPQT